MKRRIVSWMLLLCMIAALFGSCSGNEKGEKKETERGSTETGSGGNEAKPVKYADGYELVYHEIPLRSKEQMIDITPDGEEGFLLVTGMRGYKSAVMHLGTDLEPDQGGEKEPTEIERLIAYQRIGGDEYAVVQDSLTQFSGTYFLSKNGETVAKGRALIGDYTTFSIASLDGTPVLLRRDGYMTILFIGEKEYQFDTMQNSAGESLTVRGLVQKGDALYLAASVDRYDGNVATDTFVNLLETRTCLLPLAVGMAKPEIEDFTTKGEELALSAMELCAMTDDGWFFVREASLMKTDGETEEEICDLMTYGIERGALRRILPLPDGRILLLGKDFLAEVRRSTEGGAAKKTYTLGVLDGYDYHLEHALASFNRQNAAYGFRIKEYPDVGALNLAILSQEVQGIVSGDIMTMRNYAKKDLLIDWEKEIPEVFAGDRLFTSLVDAARVGGRVCFLPRTFQLSRYSIAENLTGGKTVFDSYGELTSLLKEANPGSFKKSAKADAFYQHFARNVDEWIDWDAGEAHFDGEDFTDFLKFCNSFANDMDEVNANLSAYGSYMLTYMQDSRQMGVRFIMDDPEVYGPYAVKRVFLSLPGIERSSINASAFLGVVKNGESEEAGKELIRYLFLEDDWTKSYGDTDSESGEIVFDGFSIVKEESHACIYVDLEPEVNGNYRDLDWLERTEKAYDVLWKEIEEAQGYRYSYNETLKVAYEEALRYFAGEITAEKAAEYIQNRVSIYLAEQG